MIVRSLSSTVRLTLPSWGSHRSFLSPLSAPKERSYEAWALVVERVSVRKL